MKKNVLVQGRGLTDAISVLFCLGVVFMALPVGAAEYFVNKQGNDANNGQRRDKAFLIIQKGVNALKPGDTLTIGPGEYLENVKRTGPPLLLVRIAPRNAPARTWCGEPSLRIWS